jgi:hypothetical protein
MSEGGLGSGGFFGTSGSNFGPRGSYGVWPTCGCSSLLIVLAGVILVCAGLLRLMGQ